MIVLKRCHFSLTDDKMMDSLVEKLDSEFVKDYEVSEKVPKDDISIAIEDSVPTIYIPTDLEYSQYDIDDFIRSMAPHLRTNTRLDRNIYVMKVSGKLNLYQYVKLVKFIIEINDFCTLIKK